MSRVMVAKCPSLKCFPRVSGDEPQSEIIEGLEMAFSPRERG